MTKWQLFSTLAVGMGVESEIVGALNGRKVRVKGLVSSIQREDGSGSSFNVRLSFTSKEDIQTYGGAHVIVYVKTID